MTTYRHRACAAALVLLGCGCASAASAAPHPSIRVQIVKPAQDSAQHQEAKRDKSDGTADDTRQAQAAAVEPMAAASALPSSPPAPLAKTWSVALSDMTVRQALARWADDAGWTMVWEVPVDIPLTAGADLATTHDFREAVSVLAEAVAMGETPIRPCYYANQVVRLLPYNAVCDRTGTRPPSPNP